MATETATVETREYKKILWEFREVANGCIRNRSTTPGIVERTESSSVCWMATAEVYRRGSFKFGSVCIS
jgi:hypothetical protein